MGSCLTRSFKDEVTETVTKHHYGHVRSKILQHEQNDTHNFKPSLPLVSSVSVSFYSTQSRWISDDMFMITLPETKSLHLKMDDWNLEYDPFLLGFRPIFRGLAVTFGEGIYCLSRPNPPDLKAPKLSTSSQV